FKRNENVNQTFFFDFEKEGFWRTLGFINTLRRKYDATINVYPTNRKEYNVISFLIGAKKRAAIKYEHLDFRQLGFLNNVRLLEDLSLHNVEENIRLFSEVVGTELASAPGLRFVISAEEREYANTYLRRHGINTTRPIIGFHPGGSTLKNHVNKRWQPEKFGTLGTRLNKETGASILVFGGKEEQPLKDDVVNRIHSQGVIGVDTNSLGETSALIEKCDVFVSNDSSMLHFAAAMKRKTVLIAGPINVAHSGPWQTEHRVASLCLECSPCFYYSPRPLTCSRTDVKFKCLKELSVDTVYNKVTEILKSA
ncbi:MAG: glycosyltransferase family 9 protein, partial [Bacteroidetes bacterium]|nr:glycosyltransferase family 9 protein [Bacteroidota bacterium]